MPGEEQEFEKARLKASFTITAVRLKAMHHRAHRLLNQLTAISGYSQIALTRNPITPIKADLEKILQTIRLATKDVLSCIESLDEIRGGIDG